MTTTNTTRTPAVRSWPLLLLALPAFVAIWAGWVGLGTQTGFGRVQPLPGTPLAGWTLDTRITLPIGVETYAAYALHVWLSGRATGTAARFAKWSAIGSLILGAAGQVAYHLMEAADITTAPWPITAVVACLPVAVLGMGAALAHLTAAAGWRHRAARNGARAERREPGTAGPRRYATPDHRRCRRIDGRPRPSRARSARHRRGKRPRHGSASPRRRYGRPRPPAAPGHPVSPATPQHGDPDRPAA